MKEVISEIKALLEKELPSLKCALTKENIIEINAKNKKVGGLTIEKIFDDEVVVYLGHFTHCHIGCYKNYENDQMVDSISSDAVNFIKEVLSDEIIMWAGKRSGGFYKKSEKPNSKPFFGKRREEWVWSGRFNP